MLALAAEKKIKPWIEVLDMKECSSAIQRVAKNDVRYRFVLRQDIEPVDE
jgi:alcohol dehydrogenase (NADP+)